MKQTVLTISIVWSASLFSVQKPQQPSTDAKKQSKIAAIIALQRKQAKEYYGYRRYFEPAKNSQPKDLQELRYTEF
jgi:hypothetical protein